MRARAKLAFAVTGVYSCFLYYGWLQEDVFRYEAPDGSRFVFSWTLALIEAMWNVVVALVGLCVTWPPAGASISALAGNGFFSVLSKYCTMTALSSGLSYPTAALAKSAKMVPVMIGGMCFGWRRLYARDYLATMAIIVGTATASLARVHNGYGHMDTVWGAMLICLSLLFDGFVAALQEGSMRRTSGATTPKPYELMFFANLFQAICALLIAGFLGEFVRGWQFLRENPSLSIAVAKYGFVSATGQSFVFFTIVEFGTLTLACLTTSRKVLSVLLSIMFKGHWQHLNATAWTGVFLACLGVLAELQGRIVVERRKNGVAAKIVELARDKGTRLA